MQFIVEYSSYPLLHRSYKEIEILVILAGADDNTEVFDNRMKVYTEPLCDIQAFYNAKNLLHVISGEGTIEEIVAEMGSFVKSKI
jgi:adenylate kinase family enzyme